MSAYVVKDEVINKIVSWIELQFMGTRYPYVEAVRLIKDLGYDLMKDEDYQRLARDMHKLNDMAVSYLYNMEEEAPNIDFKYRFISSPGTTVQIFKNLENWLYQCNEGKFNETPLYKIMEEMKNRIACYYISESAEYKTAQWGE